MERESEKNGEDEKSKKEREREDSEKGEGDQEEKNMRKNKIKKRWIREEGGCVRVKERESLEICGERKEDKRIKLFIYLFCIFIILKN